MSESSGPSPDRLWAGRLWGVTALLRRVSVRLSIPRKGGERGSAARGSGETQQSPCTAQSQVWRPEARAS